jgi:glycerol uptake operon antiterminator
MRFESGLDLVYGPRKEERLMANLKRKKFVEQLQDAPVIAAVKDDAGLKVALTTECTILFILYGSILNIAGIVQRAKESGKMVFVHADLIEGLNGREISADYIAEKTEADGIISTRLNVIRRAKELDLIAVQRFFLIDTMSYKNALRQASDADVIDILPAVIPGVLKRLSKQTDLPMIASGLLYDKKDILSSLDAGALGVSTTKEELWFV